MNNILIVEDEEKVANFLFRGLKNEGYECQWAANSEEIFNALRLDSYDLIILDRMLCDIDTIDLLPKVKQKQPNAMILVLTALHDIEEKIYGLRAGADDYLGKPFDFEELLARIEALMRRNQAQATTAAELSQGNLTIQLDSQRVWIARNEIELTQLEFHLLKYFLSNPEKVLSRERILNKVWGNTSDPMTNIVDVYIRRLRKKLMVPDGTPGTEGNERYIQTIRGVGYRLGPCEEP